MDYWDIACLMVQQVSLTDGMRSALLMTAREMMLREGEKGAGKRRVKNDDIEGLVRTHFLPAQLGSFSGIEFLAEVETDLGKGKVKFIADPRITMAKPDTIVGGQWENITDRMRRAANANMN